MTKTKKKFEESGLHKKVSRWGKSKLSRLFISSFKRFNSRSTTIEKASDADKVAYYRNEMLCPSGMALITENFLKGNLLWNLLKTDPKYVINETIKFQSITGNPVFYLIAADVCRYVASTIEQDKAISYYLSTMKFAHLFITDRKNHGHAVCFSSNHFDLYLWILLHLVNESQAGIFSYIKSHEFLDTGNFHLCGAAGYDFTFRKPIFKTDIPRDTIIDLSLCSDYDVKGLMLKNRKIGIGVPLTARLSGRQLSKSLRNPSGLAVPFTFFTRLKMLANGNLEIQPIYYCTNDNEKVKGGIAPWEWDMAADYTVPFACFLANLEQRNLLSIMLNPYAQERITGLYMVEPYQKRKIPVVFIHGLMSSPETWGEMINSLRNDPFIRKHYQFWFYSYSTGFPILYSASKLRKTLLAAREEFSVTEEGRKNFDRMVVVGHSMGGLIAKALLQKDYKFIIEKTTNMPFEKLKEILSEDDINLLENMVASKDKLPFIKRAIFMAVPHRGASMAKGGLAQLGIELTKHPQSFVKIANEIKRIIDIINQTNGVGKQKVSFTGISNLKPDNLIIKNLGISPIRDDVICHSIIANKQEANTPGGSDGFVKYESSHLDQAVSECIVKSDHSVHRRPEAIREVLRILLTHLQS